MNKWFLKLVVLIYLFAVTIDFIFTDIVKIVNSEDSEIEVDTFNYKDTFENH